MEQAVFIQSVMPRAQLFKYARCNGPALDHDENAPRPARGSDHKFTWLALSVIRVAWISVVGSPAGDCKNPKVDAEMVWKLLFSIELDAAACWWWNVHVGNCDVPELVDSVARQRLDVDGPAVTTSLLAKSGQTVDSTSCGQGLVEIKRGGGRCAVWWMFEDGVWLDVPHQLHARSLTVWV